MATELHLNEWRQDILFRTLEYVANSINDETLAEMCNDALVHEHIRESKNYWDELIIYYLVTGP